MGRGYELYYTLIIDLISNNQFQYYQYELFLLLQFVLEEILEVPGRLCLQWLEMRGISSVGVALPPQPVIVFGQTV